ncbi:MAG: OmpA family protein, partial [Spirochaetaceae bacterium]|nr:OmpA family protein [Spirochaetaceae bacterium]
MSILTVMYQQFNAKFGRIAAERRPGFSGFRCRSILCAGRKVRSAPLQSLARIKTRGVFICKVWFNPPPQAAGSFILRNLYANSTCKNAVKHTLKRGILCILALFLLASAPVWAEEFVFKHKTGDKFRTISTSTENVLINGEFMYGTRILNRMASEVIDERDGVAVHKALFQLAEERQIEGTRTGNFQWTGEYNSVFGRDALGVITIDDSYVMPTVRNVPVFPGRPLKPGDSWQADGCEAHDLGPTFNLNELYRLPFTAKYTFLGDKEWRGRRYAAIEISYTIDDRPDFAARLPPGAVNGNAFFPLRVRGESFQTVYWDSALGQPVGAEENFKLEFTMSDGNVYEFNGKAEAEIIESPVMDKNAMADEIREELSGEGDVRVVDEGVKINLEDILFEPDTAIFVPGEEKKLEKLAEILRKYPGRDLMIGGHAAQAGGTENSRMQLSQERAAAVAAYLIENGVRTPGHIMVRGYGSENPVADNST